MTPPNTSLEPTPVIAGSSASRFTIHLRGGSAFVRWASMRTSSILCILLLMCTGCFLGDRVPERRAVSLTLPLSSDQSGVSFSADSPQIQEALKFIDTELTSEGYVRDQIPEGAAGQGLVASYAQHTGTDLRVLGGPILYLSDGRLRVVFGAGGGMGSRIGPETEKKMETLRDALSRRYGSDKVKIER
jgi:hypothetical protein